MRTLGPKAAAGADAPQIAQEAVAVWARMDAALSPVIGKRGVAAYLIGASLTERLLQAAWTPPSIGHPAQDAS